MNAHSRFGQTHDLAAESAQPAAKGPQLPALLEGRESLLRKRLACVVHQGSFVGRRGMLDLGECVLGFEAALDAGRDLLLLLGRQHSDLRRRRDSDLTGGNGVD